MGTRLAIRCSLVVAVASVVTTFSGCSMDNSWFCFCSGVPLIIAAIVVLAVVGGKLGLQWHCKHCGSPIENPRYRICPNCNRPWQF